MDRTGWVRGGDRSAGQPMQRSGWIRAARYIAESFWRSVIVADVGRVLHRFTAHAAAVVEAQLKIAAGRIGRGVHKARAEAQPVRLGLLPGGGVPPVRVRGGRLVVLQALRALLGV